MLAPDQIGRGYGIISNKYIFKSVFSETLIHLIAFIITSSINIKYRCIDIQIPVYGM